jgi:hypothetical protein
MIPNYWLLLNIGKSRLTLSHSNCLQGTLSHWGTECLSSHRITLMHWRSPPCAWASFTSVADLSTFWPTIGGLLLICASGVGTVLWGITNPGRTTPPWTRYSHRVDRVPRSVHTPSSMQTWLLCKITFCLIHFPSCTVISARSLRAAARPVPTRSQASCASSGQSQAIVKGIRAGVVPVYLYG